jgi:tight adherence protein B
VQVSVPIEKAFQMICKRHPYEEVLAFAEIFEFGKRLGGDYGKNLRRTAEKINEKMALKQEIQALTAEKRLELLVMSVMPIGILLYMKIGTGEFMAPLYGNMFGVILMSAMLLLYFGMLKLGVFIIQVKM